VSARTAAPSPSARSAAAKIPIAPRARTLEMMTSRCGCDETDRVRGDESGMRPRLSRD
jgi:hypothetical protein